MRGEPQRVGAGRWIGARWRAGAIALLLTSLLATPARARDDGAPKDPTSSAEPAAAAAKPVAPSWHATAFVTGIGSYRIINYWSQGASMRAETLIAGHPIATIVHANRYAVIDRLTARALVIERSPRARAEDAGRERPFAFEHVEIREAGGEKVEETKLSGREVEVWRITDDIGRRTAWVSKGEPRLPLRAETFVRGSTQTITIDYSGWGSGLEIPPGFFELPTGLEVESMRYDEYLARSAKGPVGPAPVLYPDMLHGAKP